MRGSPVDAQTQSNQTGLGSGSPSPRCLASYRVSPACRFRELTWSFPRTLVPFQAIVPFSPGMTRCSRQRAQRAPPWLDSPSGAHLFNVRKTVVRDTSRPTSCSPPIQFSKTSTHASCDYQLAFEVALVPSGGQPSSRQATRFNRLLACIRDLLFPVPAFQPIFWHLVTGSWKLESPFCRPSLDSGNKSREDCFLSPDQGTFRRQPSWDWTGQLPESSLPVATCIVESMLST
jgi:hypothetical protein